MTIETNFRLTSSGVVGLNYAGDRLTSGGIVRGIAKVDSIFIAKESTIKDIFMTKESTINDIYLAGET